MVEGERRCLGCPKRSQRRVSKNLQKDRPCAVNSNYNDTGNREGVVTWLITASEVDCTTVVACKGLARE